MAANPHIAEMARMYLSGMNCREIGQQLGINAGTVWYHLKRARVRMRKQGYHGDVERQQQEAKTGLRRCRTCGEDKPLTDFPANAFEVRKRDGALFRKLDCKPCYSKLCIRRKELRANSDKLMDNGDPVRGRSSAHPPPLPSLADLVGAKS